VVKLRNRPLTFAITYQSSRRKNTKSPPPGFRKSVREHCGHSINEPISFDECAIALVFACGLFDAKTRLSDLRNA
jgi:hypothetical protein